MRTHEFTASDEDTGPVGPIALSALLLLLVAAPVMRGGNRQVALIVLEAAALAFLAAMFVRHTRVPTRLSVREMLLVFLFLSPLWLAFVYLLPLPPFAWNALSGRREYTELMAGAGVTTGGWLPLSLAPDATTVSLLAGIPLMAAFLAGYSVATRQLRVVFGTLVVLATVEVVVGMLQLAGGTESSLYFGASHRGAFGTFANPNHFANYISLAVAGYTWLAWSSLSRRQRHRHDRSRSSWRGTLAVWVAGAVFLLLGILMSRSRGAILTCLPAALAGIALALNLGSRLRVWPTTLLLVGAILASTAVVGLDSIAARFNVQQLAGDLPLRTIQAGTTMEGAAHFWPWGSGWGTYRAVYPRFQPATLVGMADYAHQDYAQMLFEGGVFAVLLIAAFGWLASVRALALARACMRNAVLNREELAAAICGVALLGFLLHSFVEFSMHIPANAIAAAFLAGVYLRPLRDREQPDDD